MTEGITAHERVDALEITLNGLSDKIDEAMVTMTNIANPPPPDRTELYKSLVKAQLEIKNAEALTDNEFTKKKYADLASVMDAVREPLAKNGIAIVQLTEDVSQSVLGIRTLMVHESGQTISDHITMSPPKLDPQGIGSCRTYMRRYAVLAMCGIAGAVDDDAEGTKEDPNAYERISTAEVEKIAFTADELFAERADTAVAKMLRNVFGGISIVGDIKAGEAEVALTALKNAKDLMDKAAKNKPPKPPTTESKEEPGADG